MNAAVSEGYTHHLQVGWIGAIWELTRKLMTSPTADKIHRTTMSSALIDAASDHPLTNATVVAASVTKRAAGDAAA